LCAAIVRIVTTGIQGYLNGSICRVRDAQREVHIAITVCVEQSAGVQGIIAGYTDFVPVPCNLERGWQASAVNAELSQVFLSRLIVCPGRIVGADQCCQHRGRCKNGHG
jgi:hypothetical protein